MTTDPTQRDVQANIAATSAPVQVFAASEGEYRSGTILVNTTGDPGQPNAVDVLVRIVPKGATAPTEIGYSDRLFRVSAGDSFDLDPLGASDNDIYVVAAGGASFSYVAEAKLL